MEGEDVVVVVKKEINEKTEKEHNYKQAMQLRGTDDVLIVSDWCLLVQSDGSVSGSRSNEQFAECGGANLLINWGGKQKKQRSWRRWRWKGMTNKPAESATEHNQQTHTDTGCIAFTAPTTTNNNKPSKQQQPTTTTSAIVQRTDMYSTTQKKKNG